MSTTAFSCLQYVWQPPLSHACNMYGNRRFLMFEIASGTSALAMTFFHTSLRASTASAAISYMKHILYRKRSVCKNASFS